jgi:hypothetical protein
VSHVAIINIVTNVDMVTDIDRHYCGMQPNHVAIHFNGARRFEVMTSPTIRTPFSHSNDIDG